VLNAVPQIRALLAKGHRLSRRLPEHDITACRPYADAGLQWAYHRDENPEANTDEWCQRELGCAHSTMLGYLRLGKHWDRYVKKRRALGDCGQCGIEFALSLVVRKPRTSGTNTGDSITGTGKGTKGKGAPAGQNHRTPLPVFQYWDRAVGGYDHDLCAANRKVALCESFSSDFRKANVRGLNVWNNGPFGMSAKLAAYLRDCGARHATMLTLASVNSNWFHLDVLPYASRIFFPSRRISFVGTDNVIPRDCMFAVYGEVPPALDAIATHSILCSGFDLP
jgi:hypothetical protein